MVFSKLKNFAAAIALVGAFGAASATPVPVPVNLGTLTTTLAFSNVAINGAFDDVMYFKAGALLSAIGSIVGLDGEDDLDGSYRFGVGDSFDTVVWAAFNALSPANPDTAVFSASREFQPLQSGKTYWFEVTGSMTDGLYTARVIPTFVPEPGSLTLMLAGFAAMVAVGRRRKATADLLGA